MSKFDQMETVRILSNLDAMSAGHIPAARRAWAHLFIALGLIASETPSTMVLTRERFMELAGKVYDRVYGALKQGPSA